MNSQLDLAAQIAELRGDLLWTKCVAGALFLCLATVSIANWTRRLKTIEANQFLLKDQKGNVVANLGQDNFGATCLTLTAKGHISVANLCVQDGEGSYLDLHNLKSESRAILTPGFNMYEPTGRIQPALVIEEAMSTHFANINLGAETRLVMGHDSKELVEISSPAGMPKITLFNTGGKPVWSTHQSAFAHTQ